MPARRVPAAPCTPSPRAWNSSRGSSPNRLGGRLQLHTPVNRLIRTGDGFELETDGGAIRADRVLLTLPAGGASRLLAESAPAAVAPLEATPTVPIAVVMASYGSNDAFGRPVGGFGFLVPKAEKAGILGTLFCHSIFPGQAPDGTLFLRTMLGGAREPGQADLDDDELLSTVRAAHSRIFGRDPEPDRVWIARWAEGISQYTVGHLDRVARPRTPPTPSASSLPARPTEASRSTTASNRLAPPRKGLRGSSSLNYEF